MLSAVDGVLDIEQQLRGHFQLADAALTQDCGKECHVANALQGIKQQILERRIHMAKLRRSLDGECKGRRGEERGVMKGCLERKGTKVRPSVACYGTLQQIKAIIDGRKREHSSVRGHDTTTGTNTDSSDPYCSQQWLGLVQKGFFAHVTTNE